MIYDFIAPTNAPFQFDPVLDGNTHTVILTWNTFGQRYYIDVFSQEGVRILTRALVGSPIGVNIQAISWMRQVVEITTVAPHNHNIGATIDLTVSGCLPEAYNGKFRMLITGSHTMTYAMSVDPGGTSQLGVVQYNLNMIEGYFNTSTMIYRSANRQFEVLP